MVRTVISDEKQLTKLLQSSVEDAFVLGLILGQCSEDKDYVVHFAPTPLTKEETPNEGKPSGDNILRKGELKRIGDIDGKWLTAHAKNITRMLPGGMWILGLYFVGPGDVFSDNSALNKIRSLVTQVHNCCKSNEYMCGCNPNNCLYVFNICSKSKKYTCNAFEVENLSSPLKPVNWKFNSVPIQWLQADCLYNMSTLSPYFVTEDNKNYSLKKKLTEILVLLSKNVQKAVCSINGRFIDMNETLEEIKAKSIERKLQSSNDKDNKKNVEENFDVFRVNLYVHQEPNSEDEKPKVIQSFGVVECNGRLSSRVFMHSRATAGETTKAIKEDVIRSYASRLEMHWDSYDESETKGKSGKSYHLLPRRVLCPLPDSNVALSEYAFPDEEVIDVINSFEEQLGIKVSADSLNGSFERLYDPKNPDSTNEESKASSGTQQRLSSRSNSTFLIVAIVAAAIVLLVSVLIQINSSS